MRVTVTLRDREAFADGIMKAVAAALNHGNIPDGFALEEEGAKRCTEAAAAMRPWVWNEDAVQIEFDTDAGTATLRRMDQ